MKHRVEAVYEEGVFKPLTGLEISDGQKVRLEVETPEHAKPDCILHLAASIYDGLTEEEIDDIEKSSLDRKNFFKKRDI